MKSAVNVMEIIAKMVGPPQPTEGGVGTNSECTGRARKERQCPGMMSVHSRKSATFGPTAI